MKPEPRRWQFWCSECGQSPARLILDGRRICGVCWHRVEAYRAARRWLGK